MSEEMRDATDEAQKYLEMVRKKVIAVEIPREGKKPLRAIFGKTPIHQKKSVIVLKDDIVSIYMNRNELIVKLLGEKCELCGIKMDVEGHHIRKLKDLKTRWRGRKEEPTWVKRMIAINRKSLFVCKRCHKDIHNGIYDRRKVA